MKKRKRLNLLKLGVFLFGVSLLLWNCEKDIETIESKQETLEVTKPPVIQTFSLNELREDSKFNELKKSYEILQNTTQAKRTEDNLILTDLLEGLDISIEVSTIKKITSSNYVSYTMLMVEPEDKSNNFSNLVIQEKEGVQRIFTVRYFVNTNEAKATQVSTEEYSSIEMRSGINSYTEPWGDPDGGGSGGSGTSGCEEYVTVCNMVNVWIPVPCGCGDLPGEGCKGSTCGPPLYPSYNLETQEKCEQICAYEGYNDQTGGTTSGSGTTGGAGSSSGTGTTTEPTDVVTTPVNSDGNSVAPQMLISQLNITDQNLINWINAPSNINKVDATFIFCAENQWNTEAQTFAKQAIKILSDPLLPPNSPIVGYTAKIQKMIAHLKQFGNPEDEFFAQYLENLIPEFTNMTVGDVYDIYKLSKNQVDNLTIKYLQAVVVPFAEAAYPFVVYALTEATLGAALPLLARIPKLPVFNSAWVNNLVRQIGLLGKVGKAGNHIRIVTTNGNAYTKSLELFKGITQNAKSVNISNGVRIADMGNGNRIIFRPLSASKTGYTATIELDFRAANIWSRTRIIKFE